MGLRMALTLGWPFTHQNRLPLKSPLETVESLLIQQKQSDCSGIYSSEMLSGHLHGSERST